MVFLAALIVAAWLAYRGMMAGVYPMLGHLLMVLVAVAAGVGFAGPLYEMIGGGEPWLYGGGMLATGVAVYALLRGLAELSLPQRTILLPKFFNHLGGAAGGFLTGLVAMGFVALSGAVTAQVRKPTQEFADMQTRLIIVEAEIGGAVAQGQTASHPNMRRLNKEFDALKEELAAGPEYQTVINRDLPMATQIEFIAPSLASTAKSALSASRLVASLAGTGEPITLDALLLKQRPPEPQAEVPAESQPATAPVVPASQPTSGVAEPRRSRGKVDP